MITQEQIDKINTLSGEQLFKTIRWAYKNNRNDVIAICHQRAKELNTAELGEWDEVKKRFESMPFPTWPKESREQMMMLEGYICHLSQVVTDTLQIKSQIMTLINHKTNLAVVKHLIHKGEVLFQ